MSDNLNKAVCSIDGYNVFINSEGYIELYQSTGVIDWASNLKTAKNMSRIVTNVKTLEEASLWIANMKKEKKAKQKPYDPCKDEKQTKLL